MARPSRVVAFVPPPSVALAAVPATDRPLEQTVGAFAKDRVRDLRRLARGMYWTVSRSVGRWAIWARRALPFLFMALAAALADRNLVSAWRSEGLRVLATYVPLMIYVYARLLLSRHVPLMGQLAKVLLMAAIIYGVKRRDLLVDRTLVPGLIDDLVLILFATRALLVACPERLISGYAEQALSWRSRVLTPQRARQR